jgi:hypothetical protein
VAPAQREFILDAVAERLHQRGASLAALHVKEGAIMAKVVSHWNRSLCGTGSIAMRIVVSAVAAVLLTTSAQAAHHKSRRQPAQPSAQAVQPSVQAVHPKPAGDPLYESCEFPWKHLTVSCPGVGGDG